MNEKHACCGTVWRGFLGGHQECGKSALHEYCGKWYCKTHHPPTIEVKNKARQTKWDAERAESRRQRELAAEQKRRADAYDRLIAINAELQSALMGALHCVREEKHPFRHWHLHAAEVLERAQQNQEASHG